MFLYVGPSVSSSITASFALASPDDACSAIVSGTSRLLWISTAVHRCYSLLSFSFLFVSFAIFSYIVFVSVSGKICLVYRGTCGFQQKVLNAQAAGAVYASLLPFLCLPRFCHIIFIQPYLPLCLIFNFACSAVVVIENTNDIPFQMGSTAGLATPVVPSMMVRPLFPLYLFAHHD